MCCENFEDLTMFETHVADKATNTLIISNCTAVHTTNQQTSEDNELKLNIKKNSYGCLRRGNKRS